MIPPSLSICKKLLIVCKSSWVKVSKELPLGNLIPAPFEFQKELGTYLCQAGAISHPHLNEAWLLQSPPEQNTLIPFETPTPGLGGQQSTEVAVCLFLKRGI